MNWGKAIILTFILFAGFIGTMIYQMCRQHINLVRDDYYQTEIAYQQQINRIVHTSQRKPVAMDYQADKQQLTFVLTTTLRNGEIHFYRPSDNRMDFSVHLPASHAGRQVISTARLARGYWRVQFTWSDEHRDYYTEQKLSL
jgi:hypothetical protein